MKDETITGSTDSNGLFTAKNQFPYHSGHRLIRKSLYQQFKELHTPLFCYNENNQLVKGVEGLEVKGPVWHAFLNNEVYHFADKYDLELYETYSCFKKHWSKAGYKVTQVYIAVQPTEKAEKQSAGEKELYYCLSDNGDLNGLYLASMREVSEHIEMDLGDIEPSDRENVQYTITPVYLTQTEFDNLPQYEG